MNIKCFQISNEQHKTIPHEEEVRMVDGAAVGYGVEMRLTECDVDLY